MRRPKSCWRALPREGQYAAHLREQSRRLLRIEGRTQEARLMIIRKRGREPPTAPTCSNAFICSRTAPLPVDFVRQALKKGDPDDDRVWLGQANLAIWSGQLPGSRPLAARLRAQRQTDDQPVWLARLSLAMASGDAAGASPRREHVRSEWFLHAEILRIRAWLAAAHAETTEKNAKSCWLLPSKSQATPPPGAARRAFSQGRRPASKPNRFANNKPTPARCMSAMIG